MLWSVQRSNHHDRKSFEMLLRLDIGFSRYHSGAQLLSTVDTAAHLAYSGFRVVLADPL